MELNQNTEKLDNYRKRAAELVGKMTLEEKVAQTLYQAPAVERLNIKAYNWWNEALHGVARAGTATVFPQAIGLAATFDEDLLEQVGDAVSTEARAKFNMQQEGKDTDIYKGLTFWAPNVNIFRDPRWGRGHETFGEDPYLTSRLGVRYIEGLQGHDENYLKAAACAKHFAVHSGPEAVRHEFDAEVTEQDLRETYLPAFEACVKEGKVEAVMGAYNRTNGVPCCGNKRLLIDILRKEWGFSGHVTSDCWAIRDFHEGHHVTGTAIESVAMAMNNGCDLNCGTLFGFLVQAVRQGLVKEERLDEAVTNLFMARMKLGVFDKKEENPYDKIPYLAADSREMKKLNEAVARRTVVLLKNKEHILPLDKNKIKTIGVIGPNADSRRALVGNYEGRIFLDDLDITKYPVYKRAQTGIGYLAQEASVFRQMSVEDNIASVLEMTDKPLEYQKEKLESLIAEFRLQKVRKNKGNQLSGGERRRTEIARCLAIDPKFIMLDEPFAGVDPIAVEDIQQIVWKLKDKNIGILITDHNVQETLSITDRAYLLFEGKILFQGTPEELAENKIVREKYLSNSFVLRRKDFMK